jgi:hypothetical protein
LALWREQSGGLAARRSLRAVLHQALHEDEALRQWAMTVEPLPPQASAVDPAAPSGQAAPGGPAGAAQPVLAPARPVAPPRPMAPPPPPYPAAAASRTAVPYRPRLPESIHGAAFTAYLLALPMLALGLLLAPFVVLLPVGPLLLAGGLAVHRGRRWARPLLRVVGLLVALLALVVAVAWTVNHVPPEPLLQGLALIPAGLGLALVVLPYTAAARAYWRGAPLSAPAPGRPVPGSVPASVVLLALLLGLEALLSLFQAFRVSSLAGLYGWGISSSADSARALVNAVRMYDLAQTGMLVLLIGGLLRGSLWARALLTLLVSVRLAGTLVGLLAVVQPAGSWQSDLHGVSFAALPLLLSLAVELWALGVLRLSGAAAAHFSAPQQGI